jgi:hypothetical protein
MHRMIRTTGAMVPLATTGRLLTAACLQRGRADRPQLLVFLRIIMDSSVWDYAASCCSPQLRGDGT